MNNKFISFDGPRIISVQKEKLPPLGTDQILVRSIISAISAGTELLLYNGQFPEPEEGPDKISNQLAYPTKYGYATVGEVVKVGKQVNKNSIGKRLFAFQPHQTHHILESNTYLWLPEDVDPGDGVFLANMETAVNLVQDGAPILGEKVAVAGQGVVGLLTTALLAYFPLARLLTLDNLAIRQEASHNLGAHKSISSNEIPKADLGQYDLVFELSGNPAALDTAIALCRQNGRVVIGSWYGTKKALVDLGGRFHHARIQLISSQVSTIAPALSGRWDKARRFEIAWEMLRRIKPARLITARHDLSEVATVYEQLDRSPKEQIQSVFVYPN